MLMFIKIPLWRALKHILPYKGQAAERISEAFSELLSMHICHVKAYKTHLLVRL